MCVRSIWRGWTICGRQEGSGTVRKGRGKKIRGTKSEVRGQNDVGGEI